MTDIQVEAISRRYERAVKLRLRRSAMAPALTAISAVAFSWGLMSLSPWPSATTLKHIASFPNCDAARAVGLAPAIEGQPGCWPRHDAAKDGRSCEPWPHC
jgi:hypothetical protein